MTREMRARAEQAKEDWQEVRTKFMRMKSRYLGDAKDDKERNNIKRMIQSLKKENERVFIKERRAHLVKLDRIQQRVRERQDVTTETNKRQELQ